MQILCQLLQRATSVKASSADAAHPLKVTMAPEIPNSWSGVWGDLKVWSEMFNKTAPTARPRHRISSQIATGYFERLVDHFWADTWLAHNAIGSEFIEGCQNSCRATIHAPALAATNCRNSMIPFRPTAGNASYFLDGNRAPPLTADLFIIDLEFVPAKGDSSEKLDLITAFRHQDEHVSDCGGFLNMTICTLVST